MPNLDDIAHVFGSDLQITSQGDLARVEVVERSKQRVLRRLLTNKGGYLFHLGYGAGVPGYVGAITEVAEIAANIRGQMLLEASVIHKPEPTVRVTPIANGVTVDVNYLVAPDRQPAALSFDVSA